MVALMVAEEQVPIPPCFRLLSSADMWQGEDWSQAPSVLLESFLRTLSLN